MKKSALSVIRERNRKRRSVNPVVNLRKQNRYVKELDPGLEVLTTATSYAKRHAKEISDLMVRSIGLVQSPDIVAEDFSTKGLDSLRPDAQAKALVTIAVRRISEILIFKMVANELVNDENLRDKLIELFVNQRFENYGAAAQPNKPSETELLYKLLHQITSSNNA